MNDREKWDLVGGFSKIIGMLGVEPHYSEDDVRECFEIALEGHKGDLKKVCER